MNNLSNNMIDIDVRQTLLNLHKAFPNLTLDDLLKVLDCIEAKTNIVNYRKDGIAIGTDPSRQFVGV